MHSCEQKTLADIQLPVYSIHFTFSTTSWKPSSKKTRVAHSTQILLCHYERWVFSRFSEQTRRETWHFLGGNLQFLRQKPLGWTSFTFTTTFSFTISYSIIAFRGFFSRVLPGKNPEKVPILGKAHLRMPPKVRDYKFLFLGIWCPRKPPDLNRMCRKMLQFFFLREFCIPPEMTHLSLIGIPVGGFNPSEKY